MACKFRVVKARLYSLAGLLYTSDSVLSHSSGGDAFQDLFLWTSISFPLAIIQIKVGKGNVAHSEELCWEELLTQSLNLHAGGFEDLHFHPLIVGWHNY